MEPKMCHQTFVKVLFSIALDLVSVCVFLLAVGAKSILLSRGHMIRKTINRADLHLFVDKDLKDRSLTHTASNQWDDAAVFWVGTVTWGTHSVWLQSPQANVWGCTGSWFVPRARVHCTTCPRGPPRT